MIGNAMFGQNKVNVEEDQNGWILIAHAHVDRVETLKMLDKVCQEELTTCRSVYVRLSFKTWCSFYTSGLSIMSLLESEVIEQW